VGGSQGCFFLGHPIGPFGPRATLHNFGAKFFSVDLGTNNNNNNNNNNNTLTSKAP